MRVAERQEPASEEGKAIRKQGDEEAGGAADDVSRQHAAEGLDEIFAEYRQRCSKARGNSARSRHQHGWNAEAAHRDLP